MRFGDDQQGADVWLPMPSDFVQGAWSDDAIQAVRKHNMQPMGSTTVFHVRAIERSMAFYANRLGFTSGGCATIPMV